MDIAKRIFEPMNDKRFGWVKNEDGSFSLSGLTGSGLSADYHDEPSEDGKIRKGFRVLNEAGKKVITDTTLDVGQFLKALRPAMNAIVNPEVAEEQTPKAKAPAKTKATATA